MKTVIIEDEPLAQKELERQLLKMRPEMIIGAILDSVEESIRWFESEQSKGLDLIFMDIQLSDGLSFEIFENVHVPAPVIFTTAFDEYAIDAFRVNSIDYLLKPITPENLDNALKKFAVLKKQFNEKASRQEKQIIRLYDTFRTDYKSRFMSKVGDDFKHINIEMIAYFYAEHKTVFLVTHDKKEYIIDYTIENLDQLVDPKQFFRLNRKYMVKIDAIEKVSKYFNGRLKIKLKNSKREDILVSRDRAGKFKHWLDS